MDNLKSNFPLVIIGSFIFVSMALSFITTGCAGSAWILKKIPAEYQETFSKIHLLMTKSEKKEFLHLSDNSDRDKFIKDFWKKRDPEPETVENEFREEYFSRINMADHYFSHEGKAGWETDRGRVYILLGPPEFKESFPMGYSMYALPSEVWYYGAFPVLFIDRNRSGSYDLSSLGARHFAQLLAGAQFLKPKVGEKNKLYEFNLKAKKITEHDILIILLIKNKNINFKSDQDSFYTDIEISLNYTRKGSPEKYTLKRNRRIMFKKNDRKDPGETSELSIPLSLSKGDYEFIVVLENQEDNVKIQKRMRIKI